MGTKNLSIKTQPKQKDIQDLVSLVKLKKLKMAENKAKRLVKIHPNNFIIFDYLAKILVDQKKYREAIVNYKHILTMNPNYYAGYNNLGIVLKNLGSLKEASACYRKAIDIEPNFPQAYNNLGNVLYESGKANESIACYKKAIKIRPQYIKAHQNLMEAYEKTNKEQSLKEALSNAKILIKNHPITKLYNGIVLSKSDKFYDAIDCLESISFTLDETKSEIQRVSTLAKSYDRIGNAEKAFEYFKQSNSLVPLIKKEINLDKNRYLNKIKIRIKFFKKLNTKKWLPLKSSITRPDPIFLIGFPRSGTTLLDTALRTHPLIEVVEEKFMIEKMIDSLKQLSQNKLEGLKKIQNSQLKKIRKVYFDSFESEITKKNNSKVFIDKLPLNIIHIGEIIKVFPNAKFIFSLRHPCDCVLSCYMQNFELNDAMTNFLDLEDTAHLYHQVMSLWSQYITIFPIKYHTVKYENLVENFEQTIRSLLNFLKLPWDSSMLKYSLTAKNRKRISTPSYNQVIKPIYSHANGRWRRYSKPISRIYPTLKPWINKFNYKGYE